MCCRGSTSSTWQALSIAQPRANPFANIAQRSHGNVPPRLFVWSRIAALRELVIGKRARGYVALYRYVAEIDVVFVLAIRSQREAGWAMDRRQICWAHLIRLFVAFSEREGRAQAFGNRLLECARLVFDYWHGYKSGTLTRAELGSWMRPVIAVVEEVLARAVAADIERLSGSCADILQHKLALWTFIDHDGVEPTNNHAERELRAFVLWRKRSFGTQSDRGNEFAERIMTVAATLRKLGKHLWSFLTLSCSAFIAKTRCPSLFATVHTATAAGNTS